MNFDDVKEFAEGEMSYTVGVGDEIKITIYGNPQDSTQSTALGEIFGYAVDENGEINIPLLKQVKIAGLTRKEIVEKLEEGYSKFIKDPHIMFDIVKYESKFYYVVGNVKNAGKNLGIADINGKYHKTPVLVPLRVTVTFLLEADFLNVFVGAVNFVASLVTLNFKVFLRDLYIESPANLTASL